MTEAPMQLVELFKMAVTNLDSRFRGEEGRLSDANADLELHRWLDGDDEPLSWSDPYHVTPDEWFFITTLYGQMTLAGQRRHIRAFFQPLFVEAARRDIRNFVPGLEEYKGLRAGWMRDRLCKMAAVLHDSGVSMAEYVEQLRELDHGATPDNPTPALDKIVGDLKATGWKTLSVFIRDCVHGNCFPIDSRVQKELQRRWLYFDERLFAKLALTIGRNPREIARMFYGAGGQ